jgi:hypothetical protein
VVLRWIPKELPTKPAPPVIAIFIVSNIVVIRDFSFVFFVIGQFVWWSVICQESKDTGSQLKEVNWDEIDC